MGGATLIGLGGACVGLSKRAESSQRRGSIMSLSVKVNETIAKYGMVERGDRILLGVSGGPDSVALFHLLQGMQREKGWRLGVAHVVHGIRGAEGLGDARFVEQLAKEAGVPFYLKEVNLPRMQSTGPGGNLEALGRRERYEFFARVAAEGGYNKVATAHTRDDQAETILMWLLRGSGRKGLGGMPPLRELVPLPPEGGGPWLVRPLIEVSRDEIAAYLAREKRAYRSDGTNLDCRYLRNWIRHRLLPRLEDRVGVGLTERLGHLAELWREEEKTLDEVARRWLDGLRPGERLMRDALLKEGKAMQRRLLRSWFRNHAGNLLNVGFEDVETALKFIFDGRVQGRLSFPGGWELCREYDQLWLQRSRRAKPVPVPYQYFLPRGGRVTVTEAGVELHSEGLPYPSGRPFPESEIEAFFDAGLLPETLLVRNFRAGDRFRPLGMHGHKKVKDLFIEKKVPLSQRRTFPLVLAGEEILWIPRLGRSEFAKTGPRTREILKVKIAAGDGSRRV